MEKQYTNTDSSHSCQNCGHEKHDGPLWKEFTDGDGKVIMIEVCRIYRGKNV